MLKTSILNIKGVGPAVAKTLAGHNIKTLEQLAATAREELCLVPGFGPVRAESAIAEAIAMLAQESLEIPEGSIATGIAAAKPITEDREMRMKATAKKTKTKKAEAEKAKKAKAKAKAEKAKKAKAKAAKKTAGKKGKKKKPAGKKQSKKNASSNTKGEKKKGGKKKGGKKKGKKNK